MVNILVLGVGGNVSQGILKALRQSNIPMRVFGACISHLSKGLYMCDEACISPYANSENFTNWLIDYCNQHNIDMITTGVEENIIRIAKDIDVIKSKCKAIFVSSSYEMLLIGQNKLLTCEWLKKNNCNYPKFCSTSNFNDCIDLANAVGYPLIAKPVNGKSANGIILINNDEELELCKNLKNYVLEQSIGTSESEFTVGCYCDKHSNLQDIIIMRRILDKGTTIYAKVVQDENIRKEVEKICNAFKPVGPLNIQLRIDKYNRPVCFELNVRFSGSTAMRSNFGYCDVKAMIKEYVLNEPITDCFNVILGEAYRYDNEMYIYGGDATDEMKRNNVIADMKKYEIKYGAFN